MWIWYTTYICEYQITRLTLQATHIYIHTSLHTCVRALWPTKSQASDYKWLSQKLQSARPRTLSHERVRDEMVDARVRARTDSYCLRTLSWLYGWCVVYRWNGGTDESFGTDECAPENPRSLLQKSATKIVLFCGRVKGIEGPDSSFATQ